MSAVITYRLIRLVSKLARSRERFLLVFFIAAWLTSTALFYISEHIVAGRPDVDIWTSLYWAIITMATVGYGDITPTRGLGWAVAGLAAVFGIAVYTLFISTLADRFLEATVKASMGLGVIRGKRIVVIGEGPICDEAIDELVANELAEDTGWIRETMPRGEVPVEFIVGELNERTLRRGGVGEAEKVIICYEDDSKAIHATALTRKINRRVHVTVLAKNRTTMDILEMLGANLIIPISILGRLLASGGFEPGVVRFISDITSAREGLDIKEETVSKPVSTEILERERGVKIVAIERGNKILYPSEAEELKEGDKIIYIDKARPEEKERLRSH